MKYSYILCLKCEHITPDTPLYRIMTNFLSLSFSLCRQQLSVSWGLFFFYFTFFLYFSPNFFFVLLKCVCSFCFGFWFFFLSKINSAVDTIKNQRIAKILPLLKCRHYLLSKWLAVYCVQHRQQHKSQYPLFAYCQIAEIVALVSSIAF